VKWNKGIEWREKPDLEIVQEPNLTAKSNEKRIKELEQELMLKEIEQHLEKKNIGPNKPKFESTSISKDPVGDAVMDVWGIIIFLMVIGSVIVAILVGIMMLFG
jgi:hypothetical protein